MSDEKPPISDELIKQIDIIGAKHGEKTTSDMVAEIKNLGLSDPVALSCIVYVFSKSGEHMLIQALVNTLSNMPAADWPSMIRKILGKVMDNAERTAMTIVTEGDRLEKEGFVKRREISSVNTKHNSGDSKPDNESGGSVTHIGRGKRRDQEGPDVLGKHDDHEGPGV